MRRINEIVEPLPDAHPLHLRAQLSTLRVRYLQNRSDQSLAGEFEDLTNRAAASAPSLKPAAIRSYFDLAASTSDQARAAAQITRAQALMRPVNVNSLDQLEAELWLQCLAQPGQPISAERRAKFEVISAQHPRRLALQDCFAKNGGLPREL